MYQMLRFKMSSHSMKPIALSSPKDMACAKQQHLAAAASAAGCTNGLLLLVGTAAARADKHSSRERKQQQTIHHQHPLLRWPPLPAATAASYCAKPFAAWSPGVHIACCCCCCRGCLLIGSHVRSLGWVQQQQPTLLFCCPWLVLRHQHARHLSTTGHGQTATGCRTAWTACRQGSGPPHRS